MEGPIGAKLALTVTSRGIRRGAGSKTDRGTPTCDRTPSRPRAAPPRRLGRGAPERSPRQDRPPGGAQPLSHPRPLVLAQPRATVRPRVQEPGITALATTAWSTGLEQRPRLGEQLPPMTAG